MKIPLFDIDGVIISKAHNKPHADAFNHVLKSVYNTRAFISEIHTDGKIDNQIIIEVLKLHGWSSEKVKEKLKTATQEMANYFYLHEHKENYVALEGVKELIKTLKDRKIPVAILSGNVERIAWRKLERIGIRKYFDFGAFGDSVFRRVDLIKIAKKKAENFLKKILSNKNFAIVGDTPRDIQCAKEGKIQVISVASGLFSEEQLKKEGPDLIIPSLEKSKDRETVINFLLN